MSFLEHEKWYTKDSQLTGKMTQFIRILFDRIADENDGSQPVFAVLGNSMFEYTPDLRMTAKAPDSGHFTLQLQ